MTFGTVATFELAFCCTIAWTLLLLILRWLLCRESKERSSLMRLKYLVGPRVPRELDVDKVAYIPSCFIDDDCWSKDIRCISSS